MPQNDEQTQKKLLHIIEPHKEHLTTVRSWNEYARENKLPSSVTLIYNFGSWNKLKQAFHLKENNSSSPEQEELLEIVLKHKRHFTSKREWSDYAKKYNLPSEAIYIHVFGSWNKVKDRLEMAHMQAVRPPDYQKEDIESILKKHGKYLENRYQWDEYAKAHRLPTYKTLRKHFTWDEILKLAGAKKSRNFSKDDLLQVGVKHRVIFFPSSITKWNEYAKEQSLPSSALFIRNYGSWKNAKVEITKALTSN